MLCEKFEWFFVWVGERIQRMVQQEYIPVNTITFPCKCVPNSGGSKRDIVVSIALQLQNFRKVTVNREATIKQNNYRRRFVLLNNSAVIGS